jgi:hypothetical protein
MCRNCSFHPLQRQGDLPVSEKNREVRFQWGSWTRNQNLGGRETPVTKFVEHGPLLAAFLATNKCRQLRLLRASAEKPKSPLLRQSRSLDVGHRRPLQWHHADPEWNFLANIFSSVGPYRC